MATKEVQTKETAQLPAEIAEELNAARQEEIREHGIETPSLKVVHGSELFKDGTGKSFDTFEGVLLAEQRINIYWADKNQAVPTCIAPDAVNGHKFGKCSQCEFNKFGSAPEGDGKACKNQSVLLVWRTDVESFVPYRINVSPTGLKQDRSVAGKEVRGFANEQGVDSCGVIAEFYLEHKEAGSQEWSVLHARSTGKGLRTGEISVEQWKEFRAVAKACRVKAVEEEIKDASTATNDDPESNDFAEPDFKPEDIDPGDTRERMSNEEADELFGRNAG